MLFILRALGSISLVIAIVALAYDGTKSYAEGVLSVTRLGQHWLNFSPGTLNGLQHLIERNVHALLWDPLMINILLAPAWLVFGTIGVFLFMIGRRRQPTNVFAN